MSTKTKPSKYETQANEFLERHGITFRAVFVRHGKYFSDDTSSRDIYECVLERGRDSFSVTFGQSIADSGDTHIHNGRIVKRKSPTAYDLLACITKCDPGSFDDFCNEYGYDTDSRNAERTYNAVVQEWLKVSAVLHRRRTGRTPGNPISLPRQIPQLTTRNQTTKERHSNGERGGSSSCV